MLHHEICEFEDPEPAELIGLLRGRRGAGRLGPRRRSLRGPRGVRGGLLVSLLVVRRLGDSWGCHPADNAFVLLHLRQ